MQQLRSYQKQLTLFTFILTALFFSKSAQAKVHLTLQGSYSHNSLGLVDQTFQGGSASVAFDISNYVRLGYTYRQTLSTMEGYKIDDAGRSLVYVKEESDVVASSIDLTFVLWYGDVFVPYIQLGVVEKTYVTTEVVGDSDATVEPGPRKLAPNAGFGLGIRLNESFSLKLSYSVSPGYKIDPELTQVKFVYDEVVSVGLTYSI